MAKQKLYTEEQVRIAIQQARHYEDWWNMVYEHETDDIIKELTPIELPSNDEIQKEADGFYRLESYNTTFVLGAKWMRDKILNK